MMVRTDVDVVGAALEFGRERHWGPELIKMEEQLDSEKSFILYKDRFKNRQDGVGYLDFGYSHIFVIPVEGGTPVQVTTGDHQHSSVVSWTPDNRSLVFSSNRNPDWVRDFRNSELYRLFALPMAASAARQPDIRIVMSRADAGITRPSADTT